MLKVYLLSALRTLLFFLTMMIGSVYVTQLMYGQDEEITKQLLRLLSGGLLLTTAVYAAFDFIAANIRKTAVWWSLCFPLLVGMTVSVFFAYSAFRLAS